MGCDIHLQIEINKKGKWYWVNEFLPKGLNKSNYIPLDTGRNYNLFAVLANVRNYYDMVPISAPKGIPEDISEALKDEEENGILGEHSFSYLTAKELEEFNWDQKVTENGFVKPEQFKVWKNIGKPKEYCGGVGGGNTKIISNEEMESLIASGQASDNYYTNVSWTTSYKEAVDFGVSYQYRNLKYLISWREDGEEIEDIRIVFGFDS